MGEDSRRVAEMVRSGEYFKESRAWYNALYIGPISERTFFLIVAVFSVLITVFSVVAVMGLLPVIKKPPIILNTSRIDDIRPVPLRLRRNDQSANQALSEFFLRNYVALRESYSVSDFALNYNFIRAHSDEPTFAAYASSYGTENPRSPASILGEKGLRSVAIESVVLKSESEPKEATIVFSTELSGVSSASKSRWTATLQYYYTDFSAEFGRHKLTGEPLMRTQDPQFQVVNYALTQLP